MKRIFKYIGLSVFIFLFVVACEEEATILNPDVSHNKPTEIVVHRSCAAICKKIISRYFLW